MRLALFDLDDTLFDGDTGEQLGQVIHGAGAQQRIDPARPKRHEGRQVNAVEGHGVNPSYFLGGPTTGRRSVPLHSWNDPSNMRASCPSIVATNHNTVACCPM